MSEDPRNTILRCVIYCRVSTDAQERDGTSLESQERACEEYANARGWTIVDRIRDTASGFSLERPGLSQARSHIRDGRVELPQFGGHLEVSQTGSERSPRERNTRDTAAGVPASVPGGCGAARGAERQAQAPGGGRARASHRVVATVGAAGAD